MQQHRYSPTPFIAAVGNRWRLQGAEGRRRPALPSPAVRRAPFAALLATAALAGCSSADGPAQKPAYDPRDASIGCINATGMRATKVEPKEVRVENPAGPVRIVFEATIGEAEAANLRPETSGAEIIGDAILYVGKTSEADLDKIEGCLD